MSPKQQQKIITYLWFDNQAEEAVQLYTSIFPDSRILDATRYGKAGPGPEGQVMIMTFELAGQRFIALNGGPDFKFNESISLYVEVDSQEELDSYWNKLLSGGGKQSQCGWLKDRFGLSWQIIPKVLPQLLRDPDPARASRTMHAMLGMRKLDIAALEAAAAAAS
jgi:predicted 3-demethylubiquinone-9 3-methyltransferase (glyoxalase superfamily)